MPSLVCSNTDCLSEFYSKHSTAKYCSRSCAGKASMRRPEIIEKQRQGMIKFSDEHLLQLLRDLALEKGRTPSYREAKGNRYPKRFGSYRNAVLLAGLTPLVGTPDRDKVPTGRTAISNGLRFKVLSRDRFRCVYCGGSPQEGYVLQVDHKIPVDQGGPTEESNLATACSLCNSGKSDSLPR